MAEDRPRIAVLTPYATTDYVGGIEIFNRQLEGVLGGMEFFAGPTRAGTVPRGHLERVGLDQPYKALRAARHFRECHRKSPFQLAICNGLYGWPLSFGHLDIPAIQVYHFTMAGLSRHALPLRGDRVTTGIVSAFFDRLAGRGKNVVAVSHSVLREVENYYRLGGRVIENAVDTSLFKKHDRDLARKMFALPDEGPIGLFVGRAEYAKGFDIFLDVARSLPDVTFVVVGHASSTEPNVRVLEDVSHARMPLCYSAADFLLLPSRYEGFSLTVLEALACDLPLVVSKPAYNLSEDSAPYGYIAESLQSQEFVRGIREVLDSRSSFDQGSTLAATYNFEIFRRNWANLVKTLLGDANPQ